MKTEIFRMTEDITYLKRAHFEIEIAKAYKYDLIEYGRMRCTAGYRVQGTSGETLQFFRLKAEAMKWAKEYLRGKTR